MAAPKDPVLVEWMAACLDGALAAHWAAMKVDWMAVPLAGPMAATTALEMVAMKVASSAVPTA